MVIAGALKIDPMPEPREVGLGTLPLGSESSVTGLVTQQKERLAPEGGALIRTMDLVLSSVLLILSLPLLLVVAIVIKVESPGPIIYSQVRVGQYNRTFRLYKLRTMRVGTPEVAKEALADGLGAYVTRVGAVLRKTSIDELPQLLNVLRADMSLVGPRPALHNQVDLISMRTDVGVHMARPGITGIAQVRGREDLPLELKVAYDHELVQSLGPALYIQLLLQTAVAVLTARGAY